MSYSYYIKIPGTIYLCENKTISVRLLYLKPFNCMQIDD